MSLAQVRLGDVCTIGRGSSPRPIKDERYFAGGVIPWVKIADATASGKYIYETGMFVNEYGASFSRFLQTGSLIFPASGTLGIPRFLGVDACIHDGWLYFSDFNGVDPEYLYYRLILLKDYYLSIAYGAAIQNINTDLVRDTKIDLPDLATQQAIASCLCNYDDLIETNRRRIALLEEAARLLYREWFVNLRFPCYAQSKMVDGLPVSWSQKTVDEMASLLSRGITPKYDEAAPGMVINQKCIRDGRLSLALARHQSKEVKADRLVQVGDILINSTGAGTLGRVAQVRAPIPDCTVDTHVTIVRPLDVDCVGFLGVALLEMESVLSTMGVGSTNQLELGRADIGALRLLVPPSDICKEFHYLVWPIFDQVEALSQTNSRLAQVRDELLPKLMSGAIQV